MDFENQEVIYCADSESIAYNPPISISHTQREKNIQTNHTIKNPNFFDINNLPYDYITNHIKK